MYEKCTITYFKCDLSKKFIIPTVKRNKFSCDQIKTQEKNTQRNFSNALPRRIFAKGRGEQFLWFRNVSNKWVRKTQKRTTKEKAAYSKLYSHAK